MRDGRSFAPDDAWRHADEAFVRGERRFEYGYFHTDGAADADPARGRVHGRGVARARVRVGRREVRVGPDGHAAHDSSCRASPTCRRAAGGAATCTST